MLTAGDNVVDWQALERLEALARLRKVVEEAGWVCGEGSQAQYDALMADLERALIERMAALEVLRFATPGHCKELRDRDLKVNVSVILDDAEGEAAQGHDDGPVRGPCAGAFGADGRRVLNA